MRVLLLTRYPALAPSSRLRAHQYLPHLRASGIEVDVSALVNEYYLNRFYRDGRRSFGAVAAGYAARAWRLLGSRSYDLVWIQKELFPYLPAFGERWLDALGIPFVLDVDDALFHGYDQHASAFVRASLAAKTDQAMRSAALVVAGNAYIGERARAAGARAVAIAPTAIDLSTCAMRVHGDSRPFVVGWVGSPTSARHLPLLEEPLARAARNGDLELRLVGAGRSPFRAARAKSVEWSPEAERAEIAEYDVGVMPLADAPWERGKCGFKLIQYMANGLPVIASPVGANRDIVEHGRTGFLASTADEWTAAIETLRSSPELRRRIGARGRAIAEAKYSTRAIAPRLESLLRAAAAPAGERANALASAVAALDGAINASAPIRERRRPTPRQADAAGASQNLP